VLCALLWLGSTQFISWRTTTLLLPVEGMHLFAIAVLAFLLGTISMAWLSQQRLWSPAGERVTLARALVGTTTGLFVVWVLPAWAGQFGLIGVMPLLVFDFRFASRAPQAGEAGVVEAWVGRYWRPDLRPLRLNTTSLSRNWWWSYLVERAQESKGYVLLTLLASSAAVSLASYTLAATVWGLLLPRLKPSAGTLVFARHHLLLGQGRSLPDTLQLTYGYAQEERVTLLLMTDECILIACFTPVVGLLIDLYHSFDRVLVIVGLCFLLGLTLLALISVLKSLKQPQRSQFAQSTFGGRAELSWCVGHSHARLAW
jgi:hypothetical protein